MDDYRGEAYLNKKNPNLHMSKEIMHSAEKSDSPKEKIRRYLDRLERITNIALEPNRESYETDIERLRRMYYRKYVIKEEDIPESYFELQKKIALEQGRGHVEYTDEKKQREREQIIRAQKESLDVWLEYLASEDTSVYPMWFKYYAFQGMVKLGSYDKEKERFSKRTASTVKPFVELDREALAMVYEEIQSYLNKEEIMDEELKKLLDGGNFGKLYSDAKKRIDAVLKDDPKSDEGIWKKYNQGSNAEILYNDIKGKGTGWCTAGALSTAETHLSGGDFYVYYTKGKDGEFTCPRIAIRKSKDKIAEIRGILEYQHIEPNMERVVEEKLKEPDFPDRDEYKKKVEDMQMMTYIHTKWKNGGLLDERDLRFLYELDSPIIGFGYKKDPRIDEIIKTRDIVFDLINVLGHNREEVSIKSKYAFNSAAKVHVGNLEAPKELINCNVPYVILGELDLSPLTVVQGVKFSPNLKDLFLESVVTLENVEFSDKVELIVLLSLTTANKVKFPPNLKKLRLGPLKILKDVEFPVSMENLELSSLTEAEGVKFPFAAKQILLGKVEKLRNVEFPNTYECESMELPYLKEANDVKFSPKLKNLSIARVEKMENVKFPESLEILDLSSLVEAKGIRFPLGIKQIFLERVKKLVNIEFPDSLDELHLLELKEASGVKFPPKLKNLSIARVEKMENIELPETLEVIDLYSLREAKNIKFPSTLKEISNCYRIEKLENVEFPDSLDELHLLELKEASGVKFPSNLKKLVLPEVEKVENVEFSDTLEWLHLGGLKEATNVTLPKNCNTIILPLSLDISGITVPKDGESKKNIINAIRKGYEVQEIEEDKIKTLMPSIEKHFYGSQNKRKNNFEMRAETSGRVVKEGTSYEEKIPYSVLDKFKKLVARVGEFVLTPNNYPALESEGNNPKRR